MSSYLLGLLPFDKHALSHLIVDLKSGASFAERAWTHGAAHVRLHESKIEHLEKGKQKQQGVVHHAEFQKHDI